MPRPTFSHHLGGVILFHDGTDIPASDLAADEPLYVLQTGIVRMEYVRGERLSFYSEDSQYGVENCPGLTGRDMAVWVAQIERYCDRLEVYRAAKLARQVVEPAPVYIVPLLPVEVP